MDSEIDRCLISGGKIFDAERRQFVPRDILVAAGRIAEVAEQLPRDGAEDVVDARGRLVLPGLIDFHLHCFPHGQLLSVDADALAPVSGTTTFVDAGTCGALNFAAFREFVIKPARSHIFAFLNISAIGQHPLGIRGLDVSEYDDERFLHIDAALEAIEKNRDHILGVKVRMCAGNISKKPLDVACRVAREMKLPVMVHVGDDSVPLDQVLATLAPGDIITHTYHGGRDSILDGNGKLRAEVLEARERGLLFDVGLDRIHSNFNVIRTALEQDFMPDFISTDLTTSNSHITIDMPTTISKFVALGLPLEEAVYRSTVLPARQIKRPTVCGELRVGAPADMGIFELRQEEIVFADTSGNSVPASSRLVPHATLVAGNILPQTEVNTDKPGFLIA